MLKESNKNSFLDKKGKRIRRFYAIFYRGYKDECFSLYRLLTITSRIYEKREFLLKFKVLMRFLRKSADVEYLGVLELNERRNCWHAHVVLRCKYIEREKIKEYWEGITRDFIVDIRKIYKVRGMLRYLVKYLLKSNDCCRILQSKGWKFKNKEKMLKEKEFKIALLDYIRQMRTRYIYIRKIGKRELMREIMNEIESMKRLVDSLIKIKKSYKYLMKYLIFDEKIKSF